MMQNQIYPYLNKTFSNYLCGFQRRFSAQQCLIAIIKKWRQSLDSGGQAAPVLSFDRELLIPKIKCLGIR